MALNNSKRYEVELLRHYHLSEFDYTAKDSEYAKGTKTDSLGEYVQKFNKVLDKLMSEKGPEVDGIKFTSAGVPRVKKENTAKIDFIKQYKLNKLNA